jgi:long-chain acyl-CoA synthetase
MSPQEWPPDTTILDVLAGRTAGKHAARVALRYRDDRNVWRSISWGSYGRVIDEIAAGLVALDVGAGDRVGVLSWNRPEWHEADFGILSMGAISVPVYPTSASQQVGYVLSHSGSRVCFVADAEQLGRVLEQRDQLTDLQHIVVFDDDVALNDPMLLSFDDELRALGRQTLERDPACVSRAREAVRPDDIATLVYTSGTTGPPKGAVITHANIMATMRSVTAIIPLTRDDRFLSFLPLSHITERSVSHFGVVAAGGETWFARSISTVAEDLPECRPTIFFAVPRVWEKMRESIEHEASVLAGLQGRLVRRYVSLAPRRARELETREYMPFHTKLEWLGLDMFVGTALRVKLGLDKARLLASGAAPIHPDLLRWFLGIGLPIAEGYGQTEVALATTLNPPDAIRIGTVGPPLPGVSVRIDGDGEVLVQGKNVCSGYWRNDAGTHELIDDDGWLYSGDLGAFDDYGYLRITGRKKDLIITAHGKNISPQNLETELATHSLIGQAVVIGDGKRYLTALVALDEAAAEAWAHAHGKLGGIESLARDSDLHDELTAMIERVNSHHARVENIRNWRVLPRPLTIAGGELTPTLKVKRATVEEHYADLIADMYAEPSGNHAASEQASPA